MIKMGDNVRITRGCIILTHDYSWVVPAGVYGEVLGGIGTVEIGDNVFIGVNSVILKNTAIGNNVIIGAGSVVSGNLESNSVYGGNPCRKIMSLEEFFLKHKARRDADMVLIKQKLREEGKCHSDKEVLSYAVEYYESILNHGEDLPKSVLDLINRTGYSEIIIDNWNDKCV